MNHNFTRVKYFCIIFFDLSDIKSEVSEKSIFYYCVRRF